MNYLGHDFIFEYDIGKKDPLKRYHCDKCNITMWHDPARMNYKFVYIKNTFGEINDLDVTCEEVMIKNIIE